MKPVDFHNAGKLADQDFLNDFELIALYKATVCVWRFFRGRTMAVMSLPNRIEDLQSIAARRKLILPDEETDKWE